MAGEQFKRMLGRKKFFLSVLVPFLALGIQWLLWPVVRPAMWFFFYPAVFFCSWFGGMAGALVSTVLSASLVVAVFIVPGSSQENGVLLHILSVLLFCAMGVLFGYFQERLRKLEKYAADSKFRALIDQSLAGIYIIQDKKFRYVNQEFANIFGYDTPDEITDRIPYEELVAPEFREQVSANVLRRELGQEKESRYIFTGVRKDGRRIEVEVHGRSFLYEDRMAVIGVLLDITGRVNAEKRLHQASTVFSSTQEGVAITDLNGVIVMINPAFAVITEYSAEEAIGKSIRFLQSDRHDPAFYHGVATALREDGVWQGEMWNRRRSGEEYRVWVSINSVLDEDRKLINYVSVFTDMNRMRHAETQLERLAHRDSLTDLPNRLLLHFNLTKAIEKAQRYGGKGAVLFIDLDRFKQVNDTLGHAAGDELLIGVASRLQRRLRANDTLARVHGDEFVIVLGEVKDVVGAATVAQDLVSQLEKPFVVLGDKEVVVGASIGIALFPDNGDEVRQLLDCADKALYQAKASRGTFNFYSPV